MFFGKNEEAKELRNQAEEWRDAALAALTNLAIREVIGGDRAARMERLARGAGILVIERDGTFNTKVSKESENDLHIVPITTEHDPQARYLANIGFVAQNKNVGAAYIRHSSAPPGTGVLALQVDAVEGDTPSGALEAASIHELVHADQDRRGEGVPFHRAEWEAEAYDVQFHVLNYYWGGRLAPLVNLRKNQLRSTPTRLHTGDAELAQVLEHPVLGFKSAIEAVIINKRYKYAPGLSQTPPHGLVQAYKKWGLVMEDVRAY